MNTCKSCLFWEFNPDRKTNCHFMNTCENEVSQFFQMPTQIDFHCREHRDKNIHNWRAVKLCPNCGRFIATDIKGDLVPHRRSFFTDEICLC